MKTREGYRHAKVVLVNRTMRIDTDTEDAIIAICIERDRAFADVVRELLARGLVAYSADVIR